MQHTFKQPTQIFHLPVIHSYHETLERLRKQVVVLSWRWIIRSPSVWWFLGFRPNFKCGFSWHVWVLHISEVVRQLLPNYFVGNALFCSADLHQGHDKGVNKKAGSVFRSVGCPWRQPEERPVMIQGVHRNNESKSIKSKLAWNRRREQILFMVIKRPLDTGGRLEGGEMS